MRSRILILFFFLSSFCFSQKGYLDSLWKVWDNKALPDSTRLKAMYDFAWDGYLYRKPDSAYYFSKLMLALAIEKQLKKYEAQAYNMQASYFNQLADYPKAMELHLKSLKLRQGLGNKKEIASSLANVGTMYSLQGNYATSIDYFTQSLKINEALGNKKGMAVAYVNIGNIYRILGELDKAIGQFEKSLHLLENSGDHNTLGGTYNDMGITYLDKKDYAKALECYEKSIAIGTAAGDKKMVATTLINKGIVYKVQGEYDKAIAHYKEGLEMKKEIGDKYGLATPLINIGNCLNAQGRHAEAIGYLSEGLSLSKQSGFIEEVMGASQGLYFAYKKTGASAKALEMYEVYAQMKDSINSEQVKKEVVRQEFKYEYEKKAAADSVRAGEEKKVVAAQFRQEQTQRYALYGGLFLLIIFGGFMFNRFRATQKQKKIIESQKVLVEEKQKEILDSIHYAKRIQRSLLPTDKYIEKSISRLKK